MRFFLVYFGFFPVLYLAEIAARKLAFTKSEFILLLLRLVFSASSDSSVSSALLSEFQLGTTQNCRHRAQEEYLQLSRPPSQGTFLAWVTFFRCQISRIRAQEENSPARPKKRKKRKKQKKNKTEKKQNKFTFREC